MMFFTILLIIALVFFILVIVMKLNEKKYKLQKSQAVEHFIKQKEINVTNLFVGSYFDLIHDEHQEMIWFCAFQKRKLQYKEIPYHKIHRVVWDVDGTPIQSVTKNKQLKVELITNKEHFEQEDIHKHVNEQYRVKESVITITLDENPPQTLDILLFSSHLPKGFKEVSQSDTGIWYDLFVSIIKKEEADTSSSAK